MLSLLNQSLDYHYIQNVGGVILAEPAPRVTFELIFSHLVFVESIWNVAPLAIIRFAFRNHILLLSPRGEDCLFNMLLSWSLL